MQGESQRRFVLVTCQASGYVCTHKIPKYDSYYMGRHAETFTGGHNATIRHWEISGADGNQFRAIAYNYILT